MLTETVERVAENNAAAEPRVIKRFDAHVVAGAKKAPSWGVPDSESKIAEKVVEAVLLPHAIGVQDQLDIRDIDGDIVPTSSQLCDEIAACVHASVRNDPRVSIQG